MARKTNAAGHDAVAFECYETLQTGHSFCFVRFARLRLGFPALESSRLTPTLVNVGICPAL